MCGIAGNYYFSNIEKEFTYSLTHKMLKTIIHRGPDHTSIWQNESGVSLGHNRLSIIDLSNAANQPFHYLHLSVVFNGELYNYVEVKEELKAKGYKFKTQSDTEVLLASYLEWGEDCVNHFMGMWAFALWDEKHQKLFCSRDRFGIKPFYYIHNASSFSFASEYKALRTLPFFDSKLNLNHVYRSLNLGIVDYRDETYYECISHLPAAHNLIVKEDKLKRYQYWDIVNTGTLDISFEDKVEIFRDKMIDSIDKHMRSDVVVGACLSGGLDSSTIASIVGKFHSDTKFNTYTVYYDGNGDVDERPFAKTVTNKYSNLIPYYLQPSENDVRDDFEKIMYHQDIPLPGSSPISQYFVMKLAHAHGAKVLLDGQGSDEYLGGYLHSFYRLIGDNLFSVNPWKGFSIMKDHINIHDLGMSQSITRFGKSILSGLFSEDTMSQIEYQYGMPFLPLKTNKVIHLNDKKDSRLNSFLYNLLFTTSLPSLLHYEDRNSMAFSIESRVPFLDHNLVEFAFQLAAEDKIHQGMTKHILRESMRGILPDEITNRKDKKGFVTPGEVKWLRGPLKFLLDEIDYTPLDFLDILKTKRIIENYKKGDNSNAKLVWRVAVLSYWLKSQ